jgi:hypothetical protein
MLPTSRNTTYAPGSQVESDDLNDIEDCIIGGGHGDQIFNLSPFGGHGGSGPPGIGAVGNSGNVDADYYIVGAATSGEWFVGIPLIIGDRIKSMTFWHQRAAGTMKFDLRKKVLATGEDESVASVSVAAGATYTSSTLAVNYTLIATEGYYLRWTAGNATDRWHHCQGVYDHP